MCEFFSLVTIPSEGKKLYFNWQQRVEMKHDKAVDSHSYIVKHYNVNTDLFNSYEYNPLTKKLTVDCIGGKDDREDVYQWLGLLDWKTIIEPLIVKPIVNPLELPEVTEVTEHHIELLKNWAPVVDSVEASVWTSVWTSVEASVRDSVRASVWASVGTSVWTSVWASVRDSVRASVWASVGTSVRASVWASVGTSVWTSVWASVWTSVRASVRASVWASVGTSVWAYVSSFFDIEYKHDFSSAIELWESGLVPSFDGKTWRLHAGKEAKVVYEWMPKNGE